MKITLDWLKENGACQDGQEWFVNQTETDSLKVLENLIKEKQLDWANWTICRLFNREQKIQYAVFAARQVLSIFEKKYPDDNQPRLAIEAAEKCIIDKSNATANAAAAYAAANAAAAYAAANAAADAAAYAANAAADAKEKMKIKILRYGISLLRGDK